MSNKDITGFDARKFAAAGRPPHNDPWRRNEIWRYTGPFSRFNRLRGMFPGFGIASVAFAGFLAYEYAFVKDEHGHGEIGGHSDHHSMTT